MKKTNLKSLLFLSAAVFVTGCQTTGTTAQNYEIRSSHSGDWDFAKEQSVQSGFYEQGRAHLDSRDIGLAINAFQRDIDINGSNVASLNGMGVAYDMLGRYDISQQYYEKALKLSPFSSVTYNNLAFSQYRQGDFENAALLADAAQAALNMTEEEFHEGVTRVAEGNKNLAVETEQQIALKTENTPEIETPNYIIERVSERSWAMVKPPPKPPVTEAPKYKSNLPVQKILDNLHKNRPVPMIDGPHETEHMEEASAAEKEAWLKQEDTAHQEEENVQTETIIVTSGGDEMIWLDNPLYRVLNGTGRPNMARRMAGYVVGKGLEIPSLGDADSFDYKKTVIKFSPGHEGKAEKMAALLPRDVELEEDTTAGAEVVLILGHDMLEFDQNLYIIENGEHII